jgi:hypothetical protein
MLGGFGSYFTHDNCKLIFSKVNSDEEEIAAKMEKLMLPMEIYRKSKNYPSYEYQYDYDIIFDMFFNIIHNANNGERGNSNAYALFQINRYKNGEHIAYLSVCDGGPGIAKTIHNQFEKGILPYFVDNMYNKTYEYTLEALFWRKRNNVYLLKQGLYNVAKMVISKNGKMGIHSKKMHTIFDSSNFDDLFETISDRIGRKRAIDAPLRNDINDYSSDNTRELTYRGVHIDIEIPLGVIK